MLVRAWVYLGLVEAALVMGGVLLRRCSKRAGAPVTTCPPGTPLHGAYVTATTMTFAGIVACQVGTAIAARTDHASLRSVGVFTNRLLLWGILSELLFAAALIYIPALQGVFHTSALGPEQVALLATFPVIVWGTDELRRAYRRRAAGNRAPLPHP